MTNIQVAEAFAQGATSGHSMNMFIGGLKGDTVFSYGYHFPIAKRTDKVDSKGHKIVLFTTRGYSITTAHHKSHVWSALYAENWTIIEVDNVERVSMETIDELSKRAEDEQLKAKRARLDYSREAHADRANKLINDARELSRAFNLA